MLQIIWKLCGAFFATAMLSIVFKIPKKYIVLAGFTGMLGWAIYMLIADFFSMDKILANFIATIIVTLVSHIIANIVSAPVTMFLIPGIIPLVPGAGMYYIVASTINGSTQETIKYFIETLQMAVAIALGIFIIDTFFRQIYKKRKI